LTHERTKKGFLVAANGAGASVDDLTRDPQNARAHDARTLELIADALCAVVVRRWKDPTDRPAERIAGAEIVE
jgi:hypothetical protein